jgi:dienelactone hydrolase
MMKPEFLKVCAVAAAIGLCGESAALAQVRFGAQGPEGVPDRRQPWLVPTSDSATASRSILFRPAGDGPFRIAVIVHASTQNRISRAQMPQPEYRALAAALVARGFAVLVPERPGHGATGGPYLEDQGGCDAPDYARAGRATADSISAAMTFIRSQPFVRKDAAVIAGHSAGGWGALALAHHNPKDISAIVVFAPGRGGHANDRPGEICAPDKLIEAARSFGAGAKVPVTWLVAQNDSYFPPDFSRRMADAFRAGGGKVDFRVLPPFGSEGHWVGERGEVPLLDPLVAVAIGLNVQAPVALGVSIKKKR